MVLTSKKHPLKFYGAILLAFIFMIVLPTGFVWGIFFIYQTDSRTSIFLAALLGLFYLPVLIIGIMRTYKSYIKNSFAITLNEDKIIFDNMTYALTDVQLVSLTGKPPLGKQKTTLQEAAVLKFRNGDFKYIFDDVYANAWQFKQALEQVVVKRVPVQITKIEKVKSENVPLENFQEFSGSQWNSFTPLLLWGVIALFLYFAVSLNYEVVSLFFTVSAFVFYMLLVYRSSYFTITQNKHLVILNHAFPFKQQVVRLSDIREVVFETHYRMPITLRVITNDFRSKSFPASTLRNRNWLELKIALEEHEIFVRNEAVQDFDWDLETIEKTSYEKIS